ncbi:MAG: 50S ribosomal protein L10 [Candidatus Omnitrophica bacterium]|nr:50S ribosomal protein L10 [Candidatus Omnitrophota bacterium]MCF7891740.1 50S ribosomal protein L10 [Candidatus Omnitrophota bacterium]MCF7896173.1 50S ribosomal protein L10 [Candidatus Omnitrophota bacterium]MCF7897659.1 50S ribosomal protein L10 [Candidatus Omnitrophota bacterium]MCF7909447.1 50S ribosomal protein L10 [Candidatus Omnitrophota bacterium]
MKAMKAKTIGLSIRENIIKKVQERVSSSSVYFFVGFSNVKSSSLSQLRNQLRLVDSYVFVAKNSLINKALEGLDLEKLEDYLQGETGIISVYNEDIVKPCKAIVDFAKENEAFAIKGGIIEGRKINKEELESLAKLPGREILLGQAVSGLAAPLTGFLACLNQIILKFVWVAEEIKKVQSQDKKTEKKVENQEEKKEEEGRESKESKEEKGKPEQKQEEKKESEDKEDKAKTEQGKEEKENDDNKSKEK